MTRGTRWPLRAILGDAVLVFSASLSWVRVIDARTIVTVTCIATLAATCATSASLAISRTQRLMAMASGICATIVVCFVLVHVHGGSMSQAMTALVTGWKRTLSIPLPVPPDTQYLALPLILTGLAAAATTAVMRRSSVLKLVPSLLLWSAGVLLGVGGPHSVTTVSVPFVAVALVALVEPMDTGRTSIGGLTTVLVVAITSLGGSLMLAPASAHAIRTDSWDPRSLLSPPIETDSLPDPIDILALSSVAKSETPVLTLRTHEIHSPFVEIANYPLYDGTRWRLSGGASPAQGQLPSASGAGARQLFTETITGSSVTWPWVGHVGEVSAISSRGLLAFRSTGLVLAQDNKRNRTYKLRASLPILTRNAELRPGTTNDPVLLDPSCLPSFFLNGMQQAASQATRPEDVIGTMVSWLVNQSGVTFDKNAATGQSCTRLRSLTPGSPDRRATSEQFAALLTLGLRARGYPARLAFGFRLRGQSVDGSYEPRLSDAAAYTEVLLEPTGWVSIDATPQAVIETGTTIHSDLAAVSKAVGASLGGRVPNPTNIGPDAPPHNTARHIRWWPIVVALPCVPIVCMLLWFLLARRFRSRRLRRIATAVDTRAQIRYAWREATVALAMKGISTRNGTASEVANRTTRIPEVGNACTELAGFVEHALYNPQPLTRAAGRRALHLAEAIRVAIQKQLPLKARLLTNLDLRGPSATIRRTSVNQHQ